MLSRLEEGGKIIIIMTRWSSKDLAGRALEHYKEEGKKVRHINMKALQEDGNMLCEEVLSLKSYKSKVRAMGEDIASANYQQEPIDLKGCLYTKFKTYDKLPADDKGNLLFTSIKAYVDTADEGADYLCAIVYGVYNKEAYILDVLYTKESMEITEYKTSKIFYDNEVNKADIESNSGGRAFARNVQRILKEKFKSNKTIIKWFHQSKNKNARILSNSSWVMEHIYFPANWRDKWQDYYKAMVSYQREGKNKHDDACFEEGTQISTLFGNKSIEKIKEGEYVFTPFGLRKVLWSGCTGEKETINKLGLKATRNHKVFSYINGFVSLDKLTGISETSIISLKELMLWKYKKLLYSMKKNIDLWDKRSIILVSQVKMKKENMLKDFMWQFGSLIIKGKFQKAIIFIIKILILLITTLTTWNVFRINNTYRYMQRKILKYINVSVKNVGAILKAKYKHLNSVQINVEKDGEVKTDSTTLIESKKVKVYNLTVEGNHVYYAHGFLVSNCDATTGVAEKALKGQGLSVFK
ncbi:phage protein [Clostridioides difficile]|nr:phage protein [Clostridioides difficile]VIF37873.1 phage protein [Clostridioides difficile]VIF44430.1 phage protein [Clostridioides difficile]